MHTVLSEETAKEVKRKLGFSNNPTSIAEQLKAIQKTLKTPVLSGDEKKEARAKNYKMLFGKYEGRTIDDLLGYDRSYLMYLLSTDTCSLPTYVKDYLTVVADEMSSEKFPDGTPMFFFKCGAHKGESIAEVALEDKSYIHWALNNTDMIPESLANTVANYLVEH